MNERGVRVTSHSIPEKRDQQAHRPRARPRSQHEPNVPHLRGGRARVTNWPPCARAVPPRPQLQPLPEFAGTASPRPDPVVQARVEAFIVERYRAVESLRVLAELTDRSFSAVRNILAKHHVHRRGAGATTLRDAAG